MNMRLVIACVALCAGALPAAAGTGEPKPATAATIAAQKAYVGPSEASLRLEREEANRGLVGQLVEPVVRDAAGNVIYDTRQMLSYHGVAPDTVNPGLWASTQLNGPHGLFKVTDGIWQVRNYDPTNMTFIEGKTGWIVIDPLTNVETARAAMGLVDQHLGKRPVRAVIYTHSHVDHFGGARALLDEATLKSQGVRVIAPDGFMEASIGENVLAGPAMTRRVMYQFGMPLQAGVQGRMAFGIGNQIPTGTVSLVAPTELIHKTGEELVVDGVRIVFVLANGTEAPAEMLFYFPDHHALCLAEDITKSMHNIYTLRGAKMRDALGWSKRLNELLDLFPDAEVGFSSHSWPAFGHDRLRDLIVKQRDMYRFIHDEAMRLTNAGKKMDDLANASFYPQALIDDVSTRGYYSSLS